MKNQPTGTTNKRYRFCGEGLGIPGLPHDVSEEEARQRGALDILMAALKAGTYQEITGADASAKESEE